MSHATKPHHVRSIVPHPKRKYASELLPGEEGYGSNGTARSSNVGTTGESTCFGDPECPHGKREGKMCWHRSDSGARKNCQYNPWARRNINKK